MFCLDKNELKTRLVIENILFRKLSFLNDLILLQTLIVFEIMRMSYVKWITRCITSSVATEFRVTTAEKSFMLFIYIYYIHVDGYD